MVSEPKAHVTKGKAMKRQKGPGEMDHQGMNNQPLLTYYINTLGGGAVAQTPIPTAKRPRVEDGAADANDNEM